MCIFVDFGQPSSVVVVLLGGAMMNAGYRAQNIDGLGPGCRRHLGVVCGLLSSLGENCGVVT